MSSRLEGKVVLITGGGSGIGQATAIELAKLGAHLAITDVNLEGAHDTYRLCGGKPHYCGVMDVSSKADVELRVSEIVAGLGRLDHVFNCAGINPTSYPLTDTTDEYWDKLVNVNLKGIYLVTRATIPHITTPGGSYVNVSSICGLYPQAEQAVYCATKHGVIGFSKSMALELGLKGVRTNVVAPGYIDTPTNSGVVKGEEYVTRMEEGNSLGRLGTPEEVAGVVAFLMSEKAKYMNGSVVEVHGGLKMLES
ncbi:NAD(P)-binding protein [Daedalea quercina L-15889]|uniref:NAD(P)-binding protein n=1 Tax=Daedalea quercina L-15889 TaxID=1314783 RepID=A0A165MCX8_9APHY|nr:NAD(P)-binding protein [Daedalea quercina L-15889]